MSDQGQSDLGDFSMLDLFRQETETQAAVLNEGLLALEQDPRAAKTLEALMRAAHSIKGAARIVRLDVAVALAHAMEDVFVAAQQGAIVLNADSVDALLKGVDMLTGLSQADESEAAGWLADRAAEIDQLVQDMAAVRSGPPPEDSAPAPPAPEETPEPEKPRTTPDADDRDRVVRVTAGHLERLMGLAGECLVEAGWLEPFANSLLNLKGLQNRMARDLDRLNEAPADDGRPLLTEARARAGACRETLAECLSEFEMFSRRLQSVTERLYREVVSSRMRPFADGIQGFPRMVRDLAKSLGKKVRLDVIGRNTEVDRDILDKLEAPLNHILRNAVDHGVQSPERRVAAGKPEQGIIRIEARHHAGMLAVSVSDDGQGIDLDALREKIVARRLAAPDMAEQMSEAELLDFLFLPGFSTAGEVTEVSGRGVGLDVVRSMVQEVGGAVRVAATPGKGVTFHLQLPITLSVVRTLLVEVSGEPYAFPLARIDRIYMLSSEQIERLEDRSYFNMDGENVGLVSARQVLGGGQAETRSADLPALVISDRLNRYGVVVDRFLGERDLVVRPLDPRLGKVRDISASALMEDGAPLLIVDVDDLARSIDTLLSGGRLRTLDQPIEQAGEQRKKRVLVVDDSLTVREVERKLLENNGYEVEVAVDGMDGWNAVRVGRYDLVITDVDMPRMNGIEFVTNIKSDARLRFLPVMIVSYKDREEDRARGLEAGANYYLTKSSFHDESLLAAVVDLIGEAAT